MQEQKNNFSIPVAIIIVGVLIAGAIYFSNKTKIPEVKNNTNQATDIVLKPISQTEHFIGNPDAPITIVEFSDTECPFCKNFQTTMEKIIGTYGKDGKVAWVYRQLPIDSLHSKSRKESEATECANELGGNIVFWKYLHEVYATTTSNDTLDPAKLPIIAKSLGLDVVKFNQCLSSGKYADSVQAQVLDGAGAGAKGTPFSVMVLKTALSSDKEKIIDQYITNEGLFDRSGDPIVVVSASKKEVSVSGALTFEMMSYLIDTVLK